MSPISEGPPELSRTSESEEMYLITVARAGEEGNEGPLPVSAVAAALTVSVASANEMVRKLAARGLVEYEPYRGVRLTPAGKEIAATVLRTRRLWSTFLAEHLAFTPSEADALACQLEHVTPPHAAERLAEFLGDPRSDPLGKPIPAGNGPSLRRSSTTLTEVPVGAAAAVVSVAASGRLRAFLEAEALVPGTEITVRGVGSSGVLVQREGQFVHLASDVAHLIEVVAEAPYASA
jgi:DtxR family Mn-dependent transcriptional regulator